MKTIPDIIDDIKKIWKRFEVWSLYNREYIVGFILGFIVGAIIL
tara:strand:- start:1981 stop:2112 length:132 start_codon:yes stop_codon:yes gene_type:complete